METILTKTRTTLSLRTVGDKNISFEQDLPLLSKDTVPPEVTHRHLWMRRQVWEEMGEPEVITVSVEPGNRLND